jgi:hypothetical protein
MTHTQLVNYWLEKMFGSLTGSTYVVVTQGSSFDIFGLPAKIEPQGLLLDLESHENEDMGTLAHYQLQLDPGVTAELCISRPPARLTRQHCLIRGQIRGLQPTPHSPS